jgi:hypothetical protein
MDSFEKCRLAFEKANWQFKDAMDGLEFDFSKQFLPEKHLWSSATRLAQPGGA